jgi:hypothetical protein
MYDQTQGSGVVFSLFYRELYCWLQNQARSWSYQNFIGHDVPNYIEPNIDSAM